MTTIHPGVRMHPLPPLQRASVRFVVAELANECAILLDRIRDYPDHNHPEVRRMRAMVEVHCEAIATCAGVSRYGDPTTFYEVRQYCYGQISQFAVTEASRGRFRLDDDTADELIRGARNWARRMMRP